VLSRLGVGDSEEVVEACRVSVGVEAAARAGWLAVAVAASPPALLCSALLCAAHEKERAAAGGRQGRRAGQGKRVDWRALMGRRLTEMPLRSAGISARALSVRLSESCHAMPCHATASLPECPVAFGFEEAGHPDPLALRYHFSQLPRRKISRNSRIPQTGTSSV